ncbi:hypothetical protein BYT27DRAFT_7336776 [Phlegmacium glaucopus]|nr:hypothetical protein BYT27DRAFT_7336776 [Phlegmacium glaucopus]
MASLCLSSASILRCESLTRNQNIFLIIPTALEVIFSISLVFIDRGPGNRNLLLTAEGLSFLILAIIELLSQIVPAVRGNLHLFKAFELAIGIASFLPLSLYIIFLYFLTNTEIVTALPRHIKSIAKVALVLFILAIIIFNEIASFIGVSFRNITTDKPNQTIAAAGFSSSTQQTLWTFFTSLTLALLIGFQVIVFCFAFFRLTQAVLDQRRIESQRSEKEQHLIKGTGWIAGSLKLGVLETVIAFAGGSFGVVLGRRILRLLVRATLCIGVAKGVDLVEDARAMKNEPFMAGSTKSRRSQMLGFISNPRLSTFRQLSPKATAFHLDQHASDIHEKSDTYRTLTTAGLPGMAHFGSVKARKGQRRVTVRYNRGTPTLQLRFSMLDIPSPTAIVQEIKLRPHSESDAQLSPPRPSFHLSQPQPSFRQPSESVFRDSAGSIPSFYGPFELVTAPRRTLSQRSAKAKLYQAASPTMSGEYHNPDPTVAATITESQGSDRVLSMKSVTDSVQAVRDLAGQFPGPPMAFNDKNTFIKPFAWEEVPIEASHSPQALGSPSELQFKEQQLPPSRRGNMMLPGDSAWSGAFSSPVAFTDNNRSSRQPTLYIVTTPLRSALRYSERPLDPFDDDSEDIGSLSRSATTDGNTFSPPPGFRRVRSLQDCEEGRTADVLDLATALDNGKSRKFRKQRESLYKIEVVGTAEWIGSRPRATSHLPHMEEEDCGLEKSVSKRDIPILPSRVKSVGKAPKKFTPPPVQATVKRGSTHLKPITIPPRGGNIPEIEDECESGSLYSPTLEGILGDSEVPGMRDEH